MMRQFDFKISLFRALALILALVSISGCSTYPSKFKCGDRGATKGLGCTMLHLVDRQIDSGQIAEAYEDKKCRGRNCLAKSVNEGLILRNRDKANIYQDQREEPVANGNSLNF